MDLWHFWELCKTLVCVSRVLQYIENVTRAFSIQGGIPRLPLPYLSQWASSTLTHSGNCFCCPRAVWLLIWCSVENRYSPNWLRRARVFSIAKRLRRPTAAVFPDWHCAEARGQNHLLTLHCHLPRLQGLLSRLHINKAEPGEKP